MEETKMYSTVDTSRILGLSDYRIKKAIKKNILIPDNIEEWRGKQGFRYMFSEETISKYATKIGITPVFDAIKNHPTKHKQEDTLPSAIVENETIDYEELGMYVVKLGHQYVVEYDLDGMGTRYISLSDNVARAHLFKEENLPDFGEAKMLYVRR